MASDRSSPEHRGLASASPERERRVVRRALLAGGGVWAVVAAVVAGANLAAGGDARGVIGGALVGLVLGSVASAGWLLLAAGLDLVANTRPSGRRLRWTIGVTLFALASPLLVLAAPR